MARSALKIRCQLEAGGAAWDEVTDNDRRARCRGNQLEKAVGSGLWTRSVLGMWWW